MTITSYTDKETIRQAGTAADLAFFHGREPGAEQDAAEMEAARRAEVSQRRAEAHRLVKAAKSPTDPQSIKRMAKFLAREGARPKARPQLIETPKAWSQSGDQPGTWAVIERRDWAGEHRIRFETRPPAGHQTPDNSGDRITAMLTDRGARKISEACYFMACRRGGFSTFATLTLGPEARAKLARRVVVPVGRVVDGWQAPEIEPARADQGEMAPRYTEIDQIKAANLAATVAGPYAALDKESRRPYTPLKPAWAWSVQREASRFFEAAGQMYRRGWQYRRAIPASTPIRDDQSGAEYTPLTGQWETVKVAGSRKLYCAGRETTAEEDAEPYTAIEYFKRRPRKGPRRAYRIIGMRYASAEPVAFTPLKWWGEPLDYLWVAEAPYQTAHCWDQAAEAPPCADEHGEMMTNPHLHLLMRWRVDYRHFHAWARRLERLWGHGFAHLEKIKDGSKAGSYVAKAAGYLSKAQGQSDQGEIRGNRYAISARARAPGWIECERHQVGLMGWLMAELSETWQKKHGSKVRERERLKTELQAANDPGQRQKIGKLLEGVRAKIEPLPRVSKYAALFKSADQKERFMAWARRRGWTEQPQDSLWLTEWRRRQLRRRYGPQAGGPSDFDWGQWFALADAGAVACNDDEHHQPELIAI